MTSRATFVQASPVIAIPGLRIDPERAAVAWTGQPLRLTISEIVILVLLTERPGVLKTRDQILDALGDDGARTDRCVDTHIKRIRRKFRAVDPGFDRIETRYGIGYAWRAAA